MTHNTITKSPEGQLIRENNKNTEIKKYEYSLKRSLIKRTPEEHLIRENEILSKTVLEILLRFSKKQFSGSQKTDEEINELLSQPNWREKAQFEVGDYQNKEEGEVSECIGHFISCPWLISAREPIEIIENLKKDNEEAITHLTNYHFEQLKEKDAEISELEQKVKKLTVFKEQIEDLEKKTVEILTKVKKEEDQEITYWEKGEPQELLNNIKKGNLVQTVIRVIKKWKRDAKVHFKFIDAAKELNDGIKSELRKEVADNSETLRVERETLAAEREKNRELQKKLEESLEMLEEVRGNLRGERKKTQELTGLLNLFTKPLPKAPKKFKIFKEKAKTKLQNLAEKTKHQSQELFARMEVRVN